MKIFLYSDGGSRGNPGVAGAGSLVLDASTKEPLAKIVYAFSDKTSNNVAEYRGLIEGLRAARALGADEVYVFMDSKLVVEQMTGRWKIKHPDMRTLAVEARSLASGFSRVTYTWVPRAQNKEADYLSNVAMDASAAGHGDGVVVEKSLVPVGYLDAGKSAAADTKNSSRQSAAADKQTAAGLKKSATADNNPDKHEPANTKPAAHWCGAKEKPTRLVLVRHGQTAMSKAGQYSGRRDAELTDLGHQQALFAAKHVASSYDIDAIYTSPLHRCSETADKIAKLTKTQTNQSDELIECDFGELEGLTFDEAHEKFGDEHARWLADHTIAAPGGESCAEVFDRTQKYLETVVDKHRGQTVVLVSHVTPIKSAMAWALGGEADVFARMFLDLASVSVIDVLGEEAVVPAQIRVFNHVAW